MRFGPERHPLPWICGAAVLARAAAVLTTRPHAPAGDPADYARIAVALLAGAGFGPTTYAEPGSPTGLRPPLWPLALAAVRGVEPARWLAVALGALTVALVVLVGRHVVGEVAARRAGWVAALLPALWWLPASLVAESLFLPLVLGAVLCALRRRAAAAGVLVGLAVLTRTNGLVVLLPVAWGLWRTGGWRPALAAALGCAVVLAPWAVRNLARLDGFVPLGTQTGFTMAGAWNDEAAAPGPLQFAWRVPMTVGGLGDLFGRPGRDEAEVDRALRARALTWAGDHPGLVVRGAATNLTRLADLDQDRFVAQTSYAEQAIPAGGARDGVRASLWLLLVAAAVGTWRLRRRGPAWVWVVPVLLLASVVLWLGGPRYRAPADPFLCLLAGAALTRRPSAGDANMRSCAGRT